MKFYWFIASLLLFPCVVLAEDELRWYTVEVIVFAHTSTAGVQEERWPDDPGIPDSSGAVSLVPIVVPSVDEPPDIDAEILPGTPIEFQELPLEILAEPHETLQRSSRYRVLEAKAWRLLGLPLESALPVRIKAGQRYLPDGEIAPPLASEPAIASIPATDIPVSTVDANTTGARTAFNTIAAGTIEDDALYELEGRIRISLTRFLDVDADLLYRTHIMLPDTLGQYVNEFRGFRLTEFRRMKSNTTHYLDHPMFGLIVAINRYELPELAGETEPKSAAALPPASTAPVTKGAQ